MRGPDKHRLCVSLCIFVSMRLCVCVPLCVCVCSSVCVHTAAAIHRLSVNYSPGMNISPAAIVKKKFNSMHPINHACCYFTSRSLPLSSCILGQAGDLRPSQHVLSSTIILPCTILISSPGKKHLSGKVKFLPQGSG
jgi:hypothetical protein